MSKGVTVFFYVLAGDGQMLRAVLWISVISLLLFNIKMIEGREPPYINPETGKQNTIEISKATTFVIGPLDERGFPDYSLYLNKLAGQGRIQTENNAAIGLIRIFGNKEGDTYVKAEVVNDVLKELGAVPLSGDGTYLVPFIRYVQSELRKESLKAASGKNSRVPFDLEIAVKKPWKSEDYPLVDRWVTSEEASRALSLLDEMMTQSEFGIPYPPAPPVDRPATRMFMTYPHMTMLRHLALLVEIQFYNDLGEKRFAEALKGIERLHWMSRITEKELGGQEYSARIVIEMIALNCDVVLAQSEGLPAELLSQQRDRLHALKHIDVLPIIEISERLSSLQTITLQARMLDSIHTGEPAIHIKKWIEQYEKMPYDFNVVMRHINAVYNGLSTIVDLPEKERSEKLNQLLDSFDAQTNAAVKVMDKTLNESLKSKIQDLILMPYDRYRSKTELVKLVIACESYHVQNGAYPTSIEQIVPRYIDAIPTDAATGEPIRCEFVEAGYRVQATNSLSLIQMDSQLVLESANLKPKQVKP